MKALYLRNWAVGVQRVLVAVYRDRTFEENLAEDCISLED
jgi:hypothetical protein